MALPYWMQKKDTLVRKCVSFLNAICNEVLAAFFNKSEMFLRFYCYNYFRHFAHNIPPHYHYILWQTPLFMSMGLFSFTLDSIPHRFYLLTLTVVISFLLRRLAIFSLTTSIKISLKNLCVGCYITFWYWIDGSVWWFLLLLAYHIVFSVYLTTRR